MILVAGGDSFVWGSELRDTNEGKNHSYSTFPALLASSHDIDYHCAAMPGNSNGAIARNTINACQAIQDRKLVVVSWTFGQRYEFRFNYDTGERTGPWYSISSWTTETKENIRSYFKNMNENILDHHVKNVERAERSGVAEFARAFFKHVGNSQYYELYSTLKEIVFLQNYLKVNNIPYLFTTADWQQANYNNSQDEYLRDLYESIDWDNWYFFPAGTSASETQYPRGFYQWAIENNYEVGTTHPLEQAHYDAYILIKDKFNELVAKNY